MSDATSLAVIILAAGQGTRMKSRRVKVLHEIAGQPMLAYVLDAAASLDPEQTLVVVGREAAAVRQAFADRARFVEQTEQRGTGHAVQVALAELGHFAGSVLILYGDTPLLRVETLRALAGARAASGATIAMLTSPEPLPGRIVRGRDGAVERVVEVTDATPEELDIQEGNTGVYLVDGEFLAKAVAGLDDRNAQGEVYLTDIVAAARAEGLRVEAVRVEQGIEALGVNTRAELARVTAEQFRRNALRWMDEGVTFVDPARTYVDTDVVLGRDCLLEPGVVIGAGSRLAENVHVKAHSVIEDSRIGQGTVIGPMAHLRPGNHLHEDVRIGNFVEVKNSELGAGVKADHLAYVGDADVGDGASFGCGAITVNYDWVDKHRTRVGARARVGCNANLIAPLELEPGSFVAAGTTVTKPVPEDAIAVSTGRQKNLEGWGERRRRNKP